MEVTARNQVDEVVYRQQLAAAVARTEEDLEAEARGRQWPSAPRAAPVSVMHEKKTTMASKRWIHRLSLVSFR